MKKAVRISISSVLLIATLVLLAHLSSKSAQARKGQDCTGVEISIVDSTKLGFVTKGEVLRILRQEYGQVTGQRLDSVKLWKIEEILNSKSPILKSQAYLTPDGLLHLDVSQRKPRLMFKTENGGYYSDADAYIFPLVNGYDARVMVIDGNIPLKIPYGYKGGPATEKERKWLEGVIEMSDYIEHDRMWRHAIQRVSVNGEGDLVLHPKKGKERLVFGRPEDFESKFDRLEDYYRYIVPSKEEGYYRTVIVKYDGQIVCRRK